MMCFNHPVHGCRRSCPLPAGKLPKVGNPEGSKPIPAEICEHKHCLCASLGLLLRLIPAPIPSSSACLSHCHSQILPEKLLLSSGKPGKS